MPRMLPDVSNDHRALLILYLIRVGEREGVSFIENQHSDTIQFTAAEMAELRKLENEGYE